MKKVTDKYVSDNPMLSECSKGDIISFERNNPVVGELVIVKIKSLPRNKCQIKIQSIFPNSSYVKHINGLLRIDTPAPIRKFIFSGDLKIYRKRKRQWW